MPSEGVNVDFSPCQNVFFLKTKYVSCILFLYAFSMYCGDKAHTCAHSMHTTETFVMTAGLELDPLAHIHRSLSTVLEYKERNTYSLMLLWCSLGFVYICVTHRDICDMSSFPNLGHNTVKALHFVT